MPDEKTYQLALTLVPGLGDISIKNLISYVGSAQRVFAMPPGKLAKVPGIGKKTAGNIKNFDIAVAEDLYKRLQNDNIRLLFYTDPDYSLRLKNIYDAPALLFVQGKMDLNHPRMLAVVGTRRATTHGKAFVRQFISDLAGMDVTIVSGLAYGIDIAAHKAALENNLPTIGVMASGPDIIYPQLHSKYARQMLKRGGLLTEYPPGTQLDPARFPARNRIVAGLCDATLVVESAAKGGAMITAQLASGYNREVFAVPGRWHDELSAGCNMLIKNNTAQAIISAADLCYYMQWENPEIASEAQPVKHYSQEEFSQEEWTVISTIEATGSEIHIDELSWKSQIQISKLAGILLNLEFKGIVNALPGKKYSLN